MSLGIENTSWRRRHRRQRDNSAVCVGCQQRRCSSMRLLILIHRYLGIAIGLVMAMWCVSGIVMMYMRFPELDQVQRLQLLEPLSWQDCCAVEDVSAALSVNVVDEFDLEMVAGRPALHAVMVTGERHVFDLRTGEKRQSFDRPVAEAVAARYAGDADIQYQALVHHDQWTVQGQFDRDRPLHRIGLGDARGTEVYVSSVTGKVVQTTTSQQRFWNWLGAVPHWLYPTVLRQHAYAWLQVVIVLSLTGVFLTLIGIYIGIAHWRAMRGKRWSPFRGVHLWHHLSGLVFGVFVLTWVASGLLSMKPWGWLEGTGFRAERELVRDVWIDGRQIAATIKAFAATPGKVYSRIESAPLGGRLYLLAHTQADAQRLHEKSLQPVALTQNDIEQVAQYLSAEASAKSAAQIELLVTGDDYYYSGHERRTFPVYRIILDNADRTRYYLNPLTADILVKVDEPARRSRWLFEGLHRLDFTAWLRQRPLWDFFVMPLLLGACAVCITGVYMGYRRIAPRRKPRK
jgi:hypothetical protein